MSLLSEFLTLTPNLNVDGSVQRINFNNKGLQNSNLADLGLYNAFSPIENAPSNSYFSFLNSNLSGFKFGHTTSNSDNTGSFSLQSFSGILPAIELFNFDEQSDSFNFFKKVNLTELGLNGDLSMNLFKITDLAYPVDINDASNKGYVDDAINTLNTNLTSYIDNHDWLTSDITDFDDAILSYDYATNAYVDNHTWTSSQITDFDAAVRQNKPTDLALIDTPFNVNNQRITNLSSPIAAFDAANKEYVDNALSNNEITLTGAIYGSGSGNISTILSPIQNISNPIDSSLTLNWNDSFGHLQNSVDENGAFLFSVYNRKTILKTIVDSCTMFFQPNEALNGNTVFSLGFNNEVDSNFVNSTPFSIIGDPISTPTSTYLGFIVDMKANLDMNNFRIQNVGSPSDVADVANKEYVDNAIISPSNISGYPNNDSLFLNGLGTWTIPQLANVTTDSNYRLIINNTDISSTFNDIMFRKSGTNSTSFGFNNNNSEGYVWSYSGSSLKLGTNNTKRIDIGVDGTIDCLTNDIVTTGTINAKTGTLRANNIGTFNSVSLVSENQINMNNNNIINVATPINLQDAANKAYVDSNTQGVATVLNNVNTSGRKLITYRFEIPSTILSGTIYTTPLLPGIYRNSSNEILSLVVLGPVDANNMRAAYGSYTANVKSLSYGMNSAGSRIKITCDTLDIPAGSIITAVILGVA